MSVTPEQMKEIQLIKAKQFLKPLLYNLNVEEGKISEKVRKMKKIKDIDFNSSFIIFSDIQIYRSVSIFGITKSFSRGISYQVMSLSMILDVWYSSYDATKMYTKDSLRTCDILILHGKNDTSYGDKKASVLVDLVNERRSYGKLTWMFVDGSTADSYKHYQPGVIEEFQYDNIYELKLLKGVVKNESTENKEEQTNDEQETRDIQKDSRKNDEII